MSPEETDEATARILVELEEIAHQTGTLNLDALQTSMLLTWIRALLRLINEQNAALTKMRKLLDVEKSR